MKPHEAQPLVLDVSAQVRGSHPQGWGDAGGMLGRAEPQAGTFPVGSS